MGQSRDSDIPFFVFMEGVFRETSIIRLTSVLN